MPTLNQVAPITTTKRNSFPSARGFGTMLLCAYQTVLPGRRLLGPYSSLTEIVAAGFTAEHRVYKMAAAAFANGAVSVVVGSRFLPSTQVVKFTPRNVTEGFVYRFTVEDDAGLETEISYTVPAAATDDSIATALGTLLGPIADMVAGVVAEVVTCTTTAGKLIDYKDLPPLADLKVEVTTADPGIATDLAALALETERQRATISWYGFSLDSCGEAECNAAGAWAESNGVFFWARNSDSLSAESGTTTDAFSDNKTAARTRTAIIFAQYAVQDYRDAAMGARFFYENIPEGAATPAYKTLNGISADKLTSAEATIINGKYGTTYTELAGLNITYEGKVGDGDFADTTINLDWLKARSQEAFLAAVKNAKKIAYTQKGINIACAAVQGVLDRAVAQGVLAPVDENGEPPKVHVPLLENTLAADRAARLLSNVPVTGRLAGAIHRASFNFTVGV